MRIFALQSFLEQMLRANQRNKMDPKYIGTSWLKLES